MSKNMQHAMECTEDKLLKPTTNDQIDSYLKNTVTFSIDVQNSKVTIWA